MESFRGRLAIVTGGGSGMGRELVRQLAIAGASVAACDINSKAATQTIKAAEVAGGQGKLSSHSCDVSSEESVIRLRDEVLTAHNADHVDLLFNNAGIVGGRSFIADSRAEWDKVFNVCWGGVYNCSRTFMPLLIASEEASIVNTASINAFWATHGPGEPGTAYAAAKFAVKGFSEALIEDLRVNAPHVKVVLVMPGSIGTDILGNSAEVLGAENDEEMRAFLASMGLPVEGLNNQEVRRLSEIQSEVLREFAAMSASEAAAIILDAVLENRWRVLVGDDARQLDEAVRSAPERSYDHDFQAFEDPPWFMPVFLLRTRSDMDLDASVTVKLELQFEGVRVLIAAADGELQVRRGGEDDVDAVLEIAPQRFERLVSGLDSLKEAEARGLRITGDNEKAMLLLKAIVPQRHT